MIQIPVLLGAIEGFFALAFLVIAFIGWILNLINQNQDANQRDRKPGQGGGGARRDRVQQDIDDFLNQNRRQGQQGGRPGGGGDFVPTQEVEVVERRTPQGRRPPANRQRDRQEVWEDQVGKPAQRQIQPRGQSQQRTQSNRPKRQVKSATQAQSKAEARSATQVGQSIQNRPSPATELVGQPLPHGVDASVSSHLGKFRAGDPNSIGQSGLLETTADRETPASKLRELMRTRQGRRQAILLGEIMSKPRVLRRS